jgi:hypothetical protein
MEYLYVLHVLYVTVLQWSVCMFYMFCMLLYSNGVSVCLHVLYVTVLQWSVCMFDTRLFFCYFVFLIDIGCTNKNRYHVTQFEYYSLLEYCAMFIGNFIWMNWRRFVSPCRGTYMPIKLVGRTHCKCNEFSPKNSFSSITNYQLTQRHIPGVFTKDALKTSRGEARDSSVRIVTMLQAGCPGDLGSISGRFRAFYLFQFILSHLPSRG